MAALSQNGYPANNRAYIHTVTVPGTTVKLPVRKGPAGDLLIWAATRWHREVEPLVPGTCWGYAERTIRGSATELSNHASGTAIDLNAPKHPLGTDPRANFTAAQIAAVRRIIADSRGCLRWGGDYTGRKDGMHIEVVASEAACATVLAQSTATAQEDDLTPDQARQLADLHRLFFTPQKPWGGGISNIPINSPADMERAEPYTILQFLLRDNVEIYQGNVMTMQLLRTVAELKDQVAALRAKLGA